MTRDMSASLKVVRIAAVCWASTSRWAIFWRMPLIRLRVSRGGRPARRPGGAAGGRGGRGGGGGRRGLVEVGDDVALGDPAAAAGALDLDGSTCSSATIRRTAGESASAAATASARRRRGGGRGGGSGPAAGDGGRGRRRPAGSIVPTVAPMATVAPSATAILRTPEDGRGTTLLALSVSSSKSGSPALTAAPSGFSQRATRMPSVIDSPTARDLDRDGGHRPSLPRRCVARRARGRRRPAIAHGRGGRRRRCPQTGRRRGLRRGLRLPAGSIVPTVAPISTVVPSATPILRTPGRRRPGRRCSPCRSRARRGARPP